MLAIARFKALSALRRRPDEEFDEDNAATIPDQSDDPATTLEKKDKSALIQKCLAGLSAQHREIVDLVYYHDKSVEEVAAIVGIRRTRSKPACSTRARSWRSCSGPQELKEVGHEHHE